MQLYTLAERVACTPLCKAFQLAFCPKWEEVDSIHLKENPEYHKNIGHPLQWDLSDN